MPFPIIKNEAPLDKTYLSYLNRVKSSKFKGEIALDYARRITYATDNSIYQVIPQAILFPKDHEDLVYLIELANENCFQKIKFTAKGGGTSTNGQSLSDGIVIDFSKHMDKILDINFEEGWAKVQPGVILDQLNEALYDNGYIFAPMISTSNRATVGGMVGTDACGQGSRIYGKTSNHILELKLLFSDGSSLESSPLNEKQIERAHKSKDKMGEVISQLLPLVKENTDRIKEKFPDIVRFYSGYNLRDLYKNSTLNLNYLIAGSEGTLAFVTELKLKIVPRPKYQALFIIMYESFLSSLKAGRNLITFNPNAIETIDENVFNLAKSDIIWAKISPLLKEGEELTKALNIVEFAEESEEVLNSKIQLLEKALNPTTGVKHDCVGYRFTSSKDEIASIWEFRKKGVGLLGNSPGSRKPLAFIEDSCVPEENLANYIEECQELFNKYNLPYGIYGHIDAGCLHVRPGLNLRDKSDEKLIRKITDKVKDLTIKYNGTLWGEHGKGYRGEYGKEFYGEDIYQLMRFIKKLFDPDNRLNPNKIVTPLNSQDEVKKLDEVPFRGQYDRDIATALQKRYEKAIFCNGNGACFNYKTQDIMCPSYKETKDRLHSPKGRASVLREWLRLITLKKRDTSYLSRIFKRTRGASNEDFAHEVFDALKDCLSCKACTTTCPIHVDIPELKSLFLEMYYEHYQRPLKDKALFYSEKIQYIFSRFPFIYNIIAQNKISKAIMYKLLGLYELPPLHNPSLKKLGKRKNIHFLQENRSNGKGIIILQDSVTSFAEPNVVISIFLFLKKLGYEPWLAPWFENGKIKHLRGMRKEFKKTVKRNLSLFKKLNKLDQPIIGIDPAVTLTYREEYPEILEQKSSPMDLNVSLLQEFLYKNIKKGQHKLDHNGEIWLLGHCSCKSSIPQSDNMWQSIFEKLGLNLIPKKVGCCGMAGIYGHEKENLDSSRKIFEQNYLPVLEEANRKGVTVVIEGYSCRSQTFRLHKRQYLHPIEFLVKCLPK